MIELPGWSAGRSISAKPARGPEAIQRRSLAILIMLIAIVRSTPLVSRTASSVFWAWKWLSVSQTWTPAISVRILAARVANSGCALMPVPTAVPPSGRSPSSSWACFSRRSARSACPAYPWNSWPSRTGVASWRWVRPVLMTGISSSAFCSSAAWSFSRAGIRSSLIAIRAASWIALGITSFEDWQMLTWSFGWTGLREPISPPSSSIARFAITSLAFMLVEVPEPVWNSTSTTS